MTQDKTLHLNSVEVHYTEVGRGKPVVLVHGVPADSRTWRYNVDVFASQFRALSPDLPGWGLSKPSKDFDNSLSGLASHLFNFARALDLGKTSLVGTGSGALISLEFALAYPRSTRALVLSDVPLAPADAPLNLSVPSGFVRREAFKRRAKGSLKRLMKAGYADPGSIDQRIVDAFAHQLTKDATVTALAELHDSIVERLPGLESKLRQIDAPVLIVHGAKDRLCPRTNADRLAGLLPNARVASIEYAGHFSHEEQPAGYNNLVLEHLQKAVGA